ncbi:putative signal transducing protein [Pseudomonas syringae]|uniref:putative signal transducing protein n=1 Tax=Pseudomonas syringae TaxID=317 RepID=UPI0007EE7477|nr:DUF2007 domain-containing protein [Pseudomonas syringae]OBS36932.1 hypothetical protein A9K81_01640 [Pseudomonas syringae pv. syringae]
MQKIYEPENLMEAELLLAMLASEGINAHLAGRDLLGAMGELPGLGLLALKVEDAQVARARALIIAYNSASPLSGDEPDDFPDVLVC